MLEHWLQPVSTAHIQGFDALTDEQVGRKITIFNPSNAKGEGEDTSLKNAQIAIIGIGSEDADAVRSAFYALSGTFDKCEYCGFGQCPKTRDFFYNSALE